MTFLIKKEIRREAVRTTHPWLRVSRSMTTATRLCALAENCNAATGNFPIFSEVLLGFFLWFIAHTKRKACAIIVYVVFKTWSTTWKMLLSSLGLHFWLHRDALITAGPRVRFVTTYLLLSCNFWEHFETVSKWSQMYYWTCAKTNQPIIGYNALNNSNDCQSSRRLRVQFQPSICIRIQILGSNHPPQVKRQPLYDHGYTFALEYCVFSYKF